MGNNPFKYIYDISKKDHEYDEDYQPRLTDKFYSNYHDTIELSSFMDSLKDIPKEIHYNTYFYNVEKSYRPKRNFPKDIVKEDNEELIKAVSLYFRYTKQESLFAIPYLSEEDREIIINHYKMIKYGIKNG